MQKTRKVAEAKAWENAKKRKNIEKKKKRKQLEYFKKLQNKVLAKDAILMIGTENSQIAEIKHKKIVDISLKGRARLCPSKKAKGKQLKKYCENTMVKIESDNFYEKYICQARLLGTQLQVSNNNFFCSFLSTNHLLFVVVSLYSHFLIYTRCITT